MSSTTTNDPHVDGATSNATAGTLLDSQEGKQVSTLPLVDHYPEVGAVAASPKSLDAAAVITADARRVVVKSVVIKTCEADDAHVKETVMHYALTLMVCEAREARLEAVAQAAATGSVAAAAAGHETIY